MRHLRPGSIRFAAALVLAAMLAVPAAAQTVKPTTTRSTDRVQPPPKRAPPAPVGAPATTPTTTRATDRVQAVPSNRPPPLPSTPTARARPAPIGAPQPPAAAQPPASAPPPAVAATVVVYDRQGRRLYGLRQAGPNRVRDERTGRYYSTVPSGDGQRIVDPPRR